MKNEFIAFRVDPDMKKKIEKIADKEGRSLSNLIQYLLREKITKDQNS